MFCRNIRNKNQEQKWSDDLKQKMSILEKQALNGDDAAMVNIAELYFEGLGEVLYDPVKACYWYEMAAEKNNVLAQYNVGLISLGELAVDLRNDARSAYWFEQAAINGDKESEELLRKKFKYNEIFNKWSRRA